jgi:thioredoxin-like negative regulator of GroEL
MKKILRFTASWCQPCKIMAENLERANIKMPIEVIDIDAQDEIAMHYGIRSVPCLVMLDENIEVKRLVGSKPAGQLREWANL